MQEIAVGMRVARRRDGQQGHVRRIKAGPDAVYLLVEVTPPKGGAHYLYEPVDAFAVVPPSHKEPTDEAATATDPRA